MAHVAGLDQLLHRADGLLDGNLGIDTRGLVQVHVVGAQPPQRVGEEAAHRLRPPVEAHDPALGPQQRAELHREEDAVALPGDRAPHQRLVVPGAVEVA
ncbi:MAG TPA: hypothetical protein VFQ39_00180, partial [Longimicrobium sp.]|nr:hypothetical protein [Longimicrobium sp.]